MCSNCAHIVGALPPKWSTVGLGFNGAETNYRIAHILGIHPTDDQFLICFIFQRHHSSVQF